MVPVVVIVVMVVVAETLLSETGVQEPTADFACAQHFEASPHFTHRLLVPFLPSSLRNRTRLQLAAESSLLANQVLFLLQQNPNPVLIV